MTGATGSWAGNVVPYKVRAGDSLSIIARDVLGDMSRWPEIAELNGISEPYTIHVGQLIKLPDSSPLVQHAAEPEQVRVFEKGLTITAEPPPSVDWRQLLGWGAVAVGLGLFIFKPEKKTSRRRRRP